ncbi:MAG: hypothetical protein ACOYJZ_07690 [Acutalibacter sp.]|jgi:CobQ-like glutamine amidotransferase family enzyme
MKIEILYPERCNLYGDLANMRYLSRCLPDAEFTATHLPEKPLFAREKVDMIYLGPMTERAQELVLEQLLPLRDQIWKLMTGGTVFLCTGNALELFGEYIVKEDGSRLDCLEIFPTFAQRDMFHRHNSLFLGTFEGEPVMGYKSQFTTSTPLSTSIGLFTVDRGVGLNKKCPFEGVRYRNFFGTYLLGPLLINNPPFTKFLLSRLGVKSPTLAFQEEVQAAYEKRLKDFKAKA